MMLLCSIVGSALILAADPLFTEGPFAGWTKVGPAAFVMDGETLIGRGGESVNSFLVSPRTYGDFELEIDLNIKPGGNSGIQIRSEVTEDGRAVSGYQIEVDTSERRWSGGVYGERFGGWRHNVEGRSKAQAAFRNGMWNNYRIVCEGPRIRSWVNGVPVADYLDADRIEGIIALQVHSGSCDIEWKNIKIIDRGRHEWRALDFTKDFAPRGGGSWTTTPQRTCGTQVQSNPEYGLLFSTKPWQDFVLSVDCEWTAGNSGVYFRAKPGGFSGITGIQCEVDGRPGRRAAGLYETNGRGWVYPTSGEGWPHDFKPGPNRYEIHCVGDLVAVDFNGQRALQLRDPALGTEGHFAFQLHGSEDVDLVFANPKVLVKATPGPS